MIDLCGRFYIYFLDVFFVHHHVFGWEHRQFLIDDVTLRNSY